MRYKPAYTIILILLFALSLVNFPAVMVSASSPVTVNLYVCNAKDTTDSPYNLTAADLAKLNSSDDNRYKSKSTWDSYYNDNEYIEFEFENITIPSGATIDSVILKFEWQRESGIDNARLKIHNGTSFIATISLTPPLPPANTDNITTIDLKAISVDTEAEINALKIWFQANCYPAYTYHDWVIVKVTYTPPTPPQTYSITFNVTPPLTDVASETVIVSGMIGDSAFNVTNGELPKTFAGIPSGTIINYTYTENVSSTVSGKRYKLLSVTGPSSSFSLTEDVTIVGEYKVQYYLNVVSIYDTPGGMGWYDACSTAYATLATGMVDIVPGYVRAVFTGWSGDASGTSLTSNPICMNGPKTAVADWKVQYFLNVTVDPSALPSIPGTDWYENCTCVALTAPEHVPNEQGVCGVRYKFIYWDVDGVSQGLGVNPICVHMNDSYIATAHYITQYRIMFNQTGVGSDFTGTVVIVDSVGYGVSTLPVYFWWDLCSEHNFSFISPLVVDGSKRYVWNSTTGLSTLQNGTLTVTCAGNVTGNYQTEHVKAKPIIWVNPKKCEFYAPCQVSNEFQVEIKLWNKKEITGVSIYAYDFKVKWDTSLISFVKATIIPPWPEDKYFVVKNIFNESGSGYYHLALTALDNAPPLEDVQIVLVRLTFHIETEPCWPNSFSTVINIDDVKLSSPCGEPVPADDMDGQYIIYSSQPVMWLEPANWSSACICKNQIVNVMVANLTSVKGFTFVIKWNNSKLLESSIQCVSVTDLIPPPYASYSVTVGCDYVQVEVLMPCQKKPISCVTGPIATICFHTIFKDMGCALPEAANVSIYFETAKVYCCGNWQCAVTKGSLYEWKPKREDLNLDCHVDIVDLTAIAKQYGTNHLWTKLASPTDQPVDIYDVVVVAKKYCKTN